MGAINPLLWDRLPFSAILQLIIANWEDQQEKKAYSVYVTDALMVISQTVGNVPGGKIMSRRYTDIMEPSKPEATRSGAEIVSDVRSAIAALGGGDGT